MACGREERFDMVLALTHSADNFTFRFDGFAVVN